MRFAFREVGAKHETTPMVKMEQRNVFSNRHASINEHPISEEERKFRWPLGRRPDDHPGLSDLGL